MSLVVSRTDINGVYLSEEEAIKAEVSKKKKLSTDEYSAFHYSLDVHGDNSLLSH